MWIVIAVFLAVVVPVVLSHHLELCRSYQNYAGGIVNHDGSCREFVYRVDKTRAEIFRSLTCGSADTPIRYRFNGTDSTVVFYSGLPDGYLDITYGISVSEHGEYSILKVVQRNHLLEKNKYALLQNEFWYRILGAVPIPYEP